jgi:hypothetical protein
MKTNIIPIPEKRKIVRMEKENVAMDIDDPAAEAKKEIERQAIPDKFSYHKEGEATSKTFLQELDEKHLQHKSSAVQQASKIYTYSFS